MSFIRQAARTLEHRDWGGYTNPWAVPAPGDVGQITGAGVLVDDRNALGIPVLWRGVNLIADTVSTTPLCAVTIDPHGVRVPVMPSPQMVVSPFYGVSLGEGLSQIVASLILRGNAYGVVLARDSFGLPTQVFICSPDAVRVTWSQTGGRDYYVSNQPVDQMDMVHISAMQLPGSPKGAGIIEYVRGSIGLNLALDDVAGKFFRNGIQSTGIISVDGQLDPDNARALAQEFVSRHAGTQRAYLPIVMGGGAKYQPLSLTLDDAQFIQSRTFQQGEIATMLGIPPHLLGLVDRTTSWGTGIEVQGRAFVEYTLRPYFTRTEQVFSSWLRPGMYAHFDTDQITRADTATRFANYAAALQNGFYCIDDVRAKEGLPPLPDGQGQIFRVMTNTAPVNEEPAMPSTPPMIPIPATDPSTGEPK